ncbi:MAG: FliH/SctL family protein [candidate division Zixibacteria bacterium]|nr:FliH/SctL family protein [candidate division Zixibacteria bacterium]
MSNICSLPLAETTVTVGGYNVDYNSERQAVLLAKETYPELTIASTPNGGRQIPLQQLLDLDRRFQAALTATHQQGLEEGRQAGQAAGLQEGQKQAREVVAALSGMVSNLTAQRETLLREAKDSILEMVVKISRKLTFSAAAVDPEITAAIIAGAIDHLLDKSSIKIKVHPGHLQAVERHLDRFRGRNTAIKEISLEADPRVRAGGCLLETPFGDIDARLESMHEIISNALVADEDVPL